MHDTKEAITKEYVVAPRLSHHLLGIGFSGAIAGACAYMAMTNTSGIRTRRTDLSPETLNMMLWVVCAAAALLSLVFLLELISTQRRLAPKVSLTPSGFSIPIGPAFNKRTLSASYAQITHIKVQFAAPNRVLRIHTAQGIGTVAELNVGAEIFEDIRAAFAKRAPPGPA